VPNFVVIGQTVAEMWRFFDIQNDGRSPSSDSLYAYLDHTRPILQVIGIHMQISEKETANNLLA